jgi:hypothetical protein
VDARAAQAHQLGRERIERREPRDHRHHRLERRPQRAGVAPLGAGIGSAPNSCANAWRSRNSKSIAYRACPNAAAPLPSAPASAARCSSVTADTSSTNCSANARQARSRSEKSGESGHDGSARIFSPAGAASATPSSVAIRARASA